MMFQKLFLFLVPSAAYAQSLISILGSNPNLTTLAGLVNSTGLGPTLAGLTNVTVLAPSNNAIATLLNSSSAASLASNPGAIQALLTYHILKGTYYSSQIGSTPTFVPSYLTNTSYTNVTGGQVVEAELLNGNVTFVSGLLTNSTVIQANVNFTGGTLHIINHVLQIPINASRTILDAGLTAAYGAMANTSVIGALDKLADVTVFAPSNAAFAAIASGFTNASMQQLTSVLEYHVVNGSLPLYSTSLKNDTMLKTVNGNNLTIYNNNGTIFVNNAKIIYPNLLVAGGVVHVIDEVLNPANTTAAPHSSATAGMPAFSGASSASSGSVPFTSGVTVTSTIAGGAAGGTTAAASNTGSASSTSSKAGAYMPMKTGSMGAAALVGAAGAILIAI